MKYQFAYVDLSNIDGVFTIVVACDHWIDAVYMLKEYLIKHPENTVFPYHCDASSEQVTDVLRNAYALALKYYANKYGQSALPGTELDDE